MDKAFHAQRVTNKIAAAEKSIDEAMALAAELLVEMKVAQDGLELSPVVTDTAFAKITEAMTQLAQARTSIVTGHKRLVKIADVAGIRTTGVYTSCPPGHIDADDTQSNLRAVG